MNLMMVRAKIKEENVADALAATVKGHPGARAGAA